MIATLGNEIVMILFDLRRKICGRLEPKQREVMTMVPLEWIQLIGLSLAAVVLYWAIKTAEVYCDPALWQRPPYPNGWAIIMGHVRSRCWGKWHNLIYVIEFGVAFITAFLVFELFTRVVWAWLYY